MPDRKSPPSSGDTSETAASGTTKKTTASKSTASKATASKATAAKSTAKKVSTSGATARKSATKSTAKSTPAKATRTTGKPGSKPSGKPGAKAQSKSASAARSAAALKSARPATGGKGKSIVNQRQTPWGLIVTTIAIVAFAAVVVIAVVLSQKDDKKTSDNPYTQPEIAAAKAIPGVIYKAEPDHTHVNTAVTYDESPPIGGNHSGYWADCSGTVYPAAIANENAVHMLEHGAVWITYRSDLPADQLNVLKQLVQGVDRMALSPYPNLKSLVSVQAWDYQLFLNNASDPRLQQFIAALKNNPDTTPEQNSTCSQPTFKQNPSTFGHPLFGPAQS